MVTRYVKAKDLLEAELGEELVALDVESGDCFGFNPVASDIWRMLDEPRDFETLHRAMLDQYDVGADECAAALRSCLADLASQGIVRVITEDG